MVKERINLYDLSPLILLLFLFFTPRVTALLPESVAYPAIAAQRYFVIPLIGFSLGASAFLVFLKNITDSALDRLTGWVLWREKCLVTSLACVHFIVFAGLGILRYKALRYGLFDLGIELQKIWALTSLPLKEGLSMMGHFQPLLLIYGPVYKFTDSPSVLLALQSLSVASTVVPVYLLSKGKLKNPLAALLIVVVFLLTPAVQYNSFNDFHLDHLYIPLLFWAYYWVERERCSLALFLVLLSALVKEPLILGAAFFGGYLAFGKKKYFLGATVFTLFMLLFCYVTFAFIPRVATVMEGKSILEYGAYNYLTDFSLETLETAVARILEVRKLLFVFFLLGPLLFLPFFSWAAFLPALPLLGVSLLSTNFLHATVNSHYAAGVIPPAFAALIFSLSKIQRRFGQRVVMSLLFLIMILTLTLNIAHGPSPLSVNFWNKDWMGGIYHYSNYIAGKREKILCRAINLVPGDPDIKVVCQGDITHARLAHRRSYTDFPLKWEVADYILLDLQRAPLVADKIDKARYDDYIKKVGESKLFKIVFEQDGIILYSRL